VISANLNTSAVMTADKAPDLIRGRTAPEAAISLARHGLISAPLQHADGP